MPRVALITNILPHYRRAIYELLLADQEQRFTLVADCAFTATVEPGIATWMPEERERVIATRSRAVFSRMIWQSGALAVADSPQFDTVIFAANMNCLSTWLGALVARLRGKRVLFWAHGWLARKRGLSGLLRRGFFHLADHLLLYGRRARAIAMENGIPGERIQVIYNSLDYAAQRHARARISQAQAQALRHDLFGSAGGAVVGCTTRLVRTRRLDLLLEAVALVRSQSGQRIRVLLVGDGPERSALDALAQRLDVQVHFAGACYDEERMAAYLAATTCVVAPGKVGLGAMHSLAFGVPVLTHAEVDDQMPEAEAVVEGLTGARFRAGDVPDLARVLRQWTQSDFPGNDVSAACIRVIERFYCPWVQRDLILEALRGCPGRPVQGEAIQPGEISAPER